MSEEKSNASGWTRRELLGGASLAAAGIAAATLATPSPAPAAPRSGAKHAPLQSF